jgi:hypothetical protein
MATQFRPTQVARAALIQSFPTLLTNSDWRLKSPFSTTYQCVAWAACRTNRKWWPVHHTEFYWPSNLPRITPPPFPWQPWSTPVDYLVQGFATLGYMPCDSRAFEIGCQKVAIYANDTGATHMARQHFLRKGWISKPGELEDIFHQDLRDLEGDMAAMAGQYGQVAQILKRSWWSAFVNFCLLRCLCHAVKFLLYRGAWQLLELKWKVMP